MNNEDGELEEELELVRFAAEQTVIAEARLLCNGEVSGLKRLSDALKHLDEVEK
jgi:hypothetical protein